MHGSQRLGSTICSSSSKGINGLFYTQAKCPSQRQRTLCSSPAGRGVRCSHSALVLLLQGGGTRSHRSVVSISCRSAENSVVLLPPPSPFQRPLPSQGCFWHRLCPEEALGDRAVLQGCPLRPFPHTGRQCLVTSACSWKEVPGA